MLAAAMILGACSAEEAATPGLSEPTAAPVTPSPALSAAPDPTDPADPFEPSDDPNASPGESPLASPSVAAVCTGTDANREFYVNVADGVTWDVYCPVLPRGWSVEAGSYRTSSGGWMKITYKASGGRRFELREGAFCTDQATCVPTGVEIAPGPFGDREATMLQVEDGGFAALVDRGQKISWAAIGKGMDETTFRAYAEALYLIPE
jgi:hypothetical protein